MIATETRLACQSPDLLPIFDAAIDGKDLDQAVAACRGCPVAAECYQHGIDTRSRGVFGGIFLTGRPRFRQGDYCSRNHPLTGPNGRVRVDGTRSCRICETAARHKREGRT